MKMSLLKKTILIGAIALSFNSFSGQVLNNRVNTLFSNKELKGLIFGSYNTDTQIAVISKKSGGSQDSIDKADEDAIRTLKSAVRDYSYTVLKEYLDGALVTGPGFNSSKMREFAKEVADELVQNVDRKGIWNTSKNETVVLYTMEKQTIKDASAEKFNERAEAVIEKLNEYKGVFQETQF